VWYSWLDGIVYPHDPTCWQAVASKVAMDQLVYAPFMTSLFFSGMSITDGQGVKGVVESLKTKLWPTILASWAVWPIAHVINFLYVPSDLRILYINVLSILWTTYLSSMAAKGGKKA
jgi:hypothetical protein